MNKCGFSIERFNRGSNNQSKSIRRGVERLKSLGRNLHFGVSKAVFPEDLKVSKKKIFDPQDKILLLINWLLSISCMFAVSVDPLFFYLPVVDKDSSCLTIDRKLAVTSTTARTLIDIFYLVRIYLQFHTAYIAPSSRVFGRGELVIDPALIAKRYLRRYFIVDFLSVLPLSQIIIWKYLQSSKGYDVQVTKNALLFLIMIQYIPRFFRIFPLTTEMKRTAGVFAEIAWAGAAYYLLWFLLASIDILVESRWFKYGIYAQALASVIVASQNFVSKFCYCLWFGLQNLSTLGQGLITTTYPGEVLFSISLAILGLILFALLIGNMQTYLQSLTIRLEEMRVKRRDSEQWMHHRLLPPELRERVRKYDQYKWLETRGVDEETLVQSLPKDLRRDIKRHLCLALVRRVPLFENMDESILDAICERLKPTLYTETTYIVREGDPVDEMLFIIRGRLESVTTDGGRSGFFNRGFLKEGDFCGEELLTWALDPKAGASLPSSTRTVKALTEVEAFALMADELKFVASQFRRLHSRQVQHTFRFYSQQWRTWAACFIQAAWRRYTKRKMMEMRRREEEEDEGEVDESDEQQSLMSASSLGATVYASRFAANALKGVHKSRDVKGLVKLQKPPEPDFSTDD